MQQRNNEHILYIVNNELRFMSKTKTRRLWDISKEFKVFLLIPKGVFIEPQIINSVNKIYYVPIFNNNLIFFKLLNILLFIIFTLKYSFKRNIDIIYTVPTYVIICGYITKLLLRKKWIVDLYDNPIPVIEKTGLTKIVYSIGIKIIRYLINKADLVIVGIVAEAIPWLKNKHVIYVTNGVDLELYSQKVGRNKPNKPQNDLVTMVYIESSIIKSGIEIMLLAINRLIKDYKIRNIRLLLIGFLDGKEVIESYIQKLNLQNYVFYLGPISSEKLPNILLEADIGIIALPGGPHRDETYPLKVFEYMAAGLAIVSSNLKGISEIIKDEETGILVSPEDPSAFANGIKRIVENHSLRELLSNKAREKAYLYDWEKINSKIIKEIKKIC